jgi:Leucine-rich repeat (LRR) protein
MKNDTGHTHTRWTLSGEPSAPALYLDRSYLSEIPPEVFEMGWLEHLDLSGNYIGTLPSEIEKLTRLKIVDLTRVSPFSRAKRS